jgi:hypothetical protein
MIGRIFEVQVPPHTARLNWCQNCGFESHMLPLRQLLKLLMDAIAPGLEMAPTFSKRNWVCPKILHAYTPKLLFKWVCQEIADWQFYFHDSEPMSK